MLTKQSITKVLQKVLDPELQVSLWDMGLIYNITVGKKGEVGILMTLTSIGCPLFPDIENDIKENLLKVKGVTSVTVDVTFDPPWTIDKMSAEAKEKMGL